MGYYDSKENVEEYIDMAEGYDGRELIEVLQKYLTAGSTVLELGMGPGKDLALLGEYYRAIGSDRSQLFLDRCRQAHPAADLLHLDAITVDTDRRFDAICSNKVLHYLTKSELQQSFQAQARVLNPQDIALHSLARVRKHSFRRFQKKSSSKHHGNTRSIGLNGQVNREMEGDNLT